MTVRLSEKEVIDKLIKGARKYSKYAGTDILFIFASSQSGNFLFYEVSFLKENFQHLVGVRNHELGASGFYDSCYNGTVTIQDCVPSATKNNMYQKISIIERALDFEKAKIYKMGEKDKATIYDDFKMATGNQILTLGYKIFNNNCKATPTTLLAAPISDYSTPDSLFKIFYVLQKQMSHTYNSIIFEQKAGVLKTDYLVFSQELKDLIDKSLIV